MRRALIPPRVMVQIQLMIILRIPPPARLQDLRRDLPILKPLLLRRLRDLHRLGFLLGGVVEDGAAVLRARVHALPVLGGGVVHAVEKLQEVGVGDAGRVEGYLEGFGIYRRPCCQQSPT